MNGPLAPPPEPGMRRTRLDAAYRLRPAEPRDVDAIVGLIRGLAEFEQLTHLLQVTPGKLRPHLFGSRPVAEAFVAEAIGGLGPGRIRQGGEGGDEQGADDSSDKAGDGDRIGDGDDNPDGDLIGDGDGVVAFALFFTNFSTFLAQPGLYLEDLYVLPAHRGRGLGEALLTRLGRLAVERGYGRFEWSVLDWNEHAIRFYRRMGASVMPDWRICRISGDALAAFRA